MIELSFLCELDSHSTVAAVPCIFFFILLESLERKCLVDYVLLKLDR